MKKKISLLVIIIVGVLVAALLGWLIYNNIPPSNKTLFEDTWNISLPKTLKEIESFSTPTSFHGDGLRYVLYKDKNAENDYYNDFVLDENNAATTLVSNTMKKHLDSGISVTHELFEFDYEYKIKHITANIDDWIVMIWMPQSNQLMIVHYLM